MDVDAQLNMPWTQMEKAEQSMAAVAASAAGAAAADAAAPDAEVVDAEFADAEECPTVALEGAAVVCSIQSSYHLGPPQ